MKMLTTVLFAGIVSFNLYAADVQCGSFKASHKRTYPINDAAIELAANLGLKTCTGTSSTRFADTMKEKGLSGEFVVVSKEKLDEARAKLKAKGGAAGPSW